MNRSSARRWSALAVLLGFTLIANLAPSASSQEAPPDRQPVAAAHVEGPLPGTVPGDPKAPNIEDTYPFFSTDLDLAAAGYVEEEFIIEGGADAYALTGDRLADDVPYRTRMVVRRPARQRDFNGTVLVEWQNVSAGIDLDALWSGEQIMRDGYAWVGVSAQRVGVDQLRTWSPARYGDLDVTGGQTYVADELSYDIFAQAAKTLTARSDVRPLGRLRARNVLGIGASQSAGRMTVFYDNVLPQTEAVFDGYGFIVGSAPTRVGEEPVFHVLSETDVRTPARAPDTDQYRRWEVAGTAHSGWEGQVYRQSITERDLGAPAAYECAQPPFSRVPMRHVLAAAYHHLVRWVTRGTPPPTAPVFEFNPDGTKARDELGLAKGGIRLSQVEAPTALNTGDNSGEAFCRLFGTHVPFDGATLDELYPSKGRYVAKVVRADVHNIHEGYLRWEDALANRREAIGSDVGE